MPARSPADEQRVYSEYEARFDAAADTAYGWTADPLRIPTTYERRLTLDGDQLFLTAHAIPVQMRTTIQQASLATSQVA